MRRLIGLGGLVSVAVAVTAAFLSLSAGDRVPETKHVTAKDAASLVVHEWGTFTNFSGSDGVQLEFRPLLERDLPGFVVDYQEHFGRSLGKYELRAFQRMETPVTYFYTPVERDVQVRVAFPQGLLTEFFPPVVELTPAPPEDAGFLGDPVANMPLKDGSLDWGTVRLIPIDSLTTQVADRALAKSMGRFLERELVPAAAAHPHYVHARDTDSALVDVRFEKSHGQVGTGDYFEKFLFYRGVGNFKLPLTLAAHGEGAYELTNKGSDAIRSLFLVTIKGDKVRFNLYDRISADSALTLVAGQQDVTVDGLAESMVAALTLEGLYPKEAQAMVNSWRDSWFAEEGTRLLYIVPQRLTDELLPLEVSPRPDETVRVLVGRMEIMAPEDERRILELVLRSASARAAEQQNPKAGTATDATGRGVPRAAVFNELLALGRLAEPALVRAQHVATDKTSRDEAAMLAFELRRHLQQQ